MYVVKRFVVCGYRFEAVATTVPPDQDGGTYPRPAPRLLGPTTKPAPLISRKARCAFSDREIPLDPNHPAWPRFVGKSDHNEVRAAVHIIDIKGDVCTIQQKPWRPIL